MCTGTANGIPRGTCVCTQRFAPACPPERTECALLSIKRSFQSRSCVEPRAIAPRAARTLATSKVFLNVVLALGWHRACTSRLTYVHGSVHRRE